MKDIMDIYEDSKFPTLLEILFFLIIVMELTLSGWITFMASLHIEKMPYLRVIYMILIPVTYIFPLIDLIAIKKSKKRVLLINNIYLSCRFFYFSFFFINEMRYRLAEIADKADSSKVSEILFSCVFSILFTLVFSVVWIVLINASKKIKYYINDTYDAKRTA